ncbi:MAG: glycosyltransferase family 39 protein [Chloroflexi bacterium]|nr:glycosyltransferase family 39 protein [Chloroflexota bacterium]
MICGRIPQRDAASRWIVVFIVLLTLAFHLWGIQRNLPYTAEVDEHFFVLPAVRIASSGNLNPGWFGHPGSTITYPLAGVYHVWNAVAHRGTLFRLDPNLQVNFDANPSEFYLLGRLLTSLYSALSVPFVYLVGRRVFGRRVALAGSFLSVFVPIVALYAQYVRTDTAATFFGMVSVWLCLRTYDRPTMANNVMAGFVIGLSISTRYFMVALVPLLIAANAAHLWQRSPSFRGVIARLRGATAGSLVAVLGFGLSTPYFFLDFPAALKSLSEEAESAHLGMDGLSTLGNIAWYLREAIPQNMTWPEAILAAVGAGLIVWRRQTAQLLLLWFVLVVLFGTSLSALHGHRWMFQIIPVLALFVADTLSLIVRFISARLQMSLVAGRALFLLAVLLVAVWPLSQVVLYHVTQMNPTRVQAREWIVQNLPAKSRILQEWYAAALGGTDFDVTERAVLAAGPTLDDYYREGYRYLVASNYMYSRVLLEPERYRAQAAFYDALFNEERLLKRFDPAFDLGGPIIEIYELRERPPK